MNRILILGVHPDDETLGAGGAAFLHAQAGDHVTICNVTCADPERTSQEERDRRRAETLNAHGILGAKKSVFLDLHSTKLDTYPFRDFVETVSGVLKDVSPEVIYTHFWRDVNVEHRIFSEVLETCTRPKPGSTVREIYSYYVPSSTDWTHFASDARFAANHFIPLTEEALDAKKAALRAYESEILHFPHPRSERSLEIQAGFWGSMIGVPRAEPFHLVRSVRSIGRV